MTAWVALLVSAGSAPALVLQGGLPSLSSDVGSILAGLEPYTRMPLAEAKTFPPAAYTSPGIFELECEKIFRPGWLCVAHVSQLRNKGDYVTMDLLGELLLVVNDGSSIRVLSRVCSHRWAPVVAEGAGCAKRFTCPFHLWTFDLEGACVAAPLMDDVDANDHPLAVYKSEVVGGFVFVNIDGTADSLAPQLDEMTRFLSNWDTESLDVYLDLSYDCEFNWKIVVETFMECYHHIGAHSTTFEPNFPANLSWTEDARPAFSVGHAAPRPGRESEAFDLGLPFFPNLATEAERQAFALFNVFPTHLLHAMPDRLLWFRLQPIAADRTVVRTFALVHPNTRHLSDFDKIRDQQRSIMDSINLEDIAVNRMQQIGAKSGKVQPGRLNPRLEKALWQLNTYVAGKLCTSRGITA